MSARASVLVAVLLLSALSCGGVVGGLDPLDAGSGVDAGVVNDAGLQNDSGVVNDAGVPDDAGVMNDAGVPDDAGVMNDAGVTNDAGVMNDAGVTTDAGVTVDAGVTHDAGVMIDAGVDAGFPGPVRAMWTSNAGAMVGGSAAGSATRTTFFANLASRSMNRVVLEASQMLASNRPGLKNFVEDAHARGIDVEVMVNARTTSNGMPITILQSAQTVATHAANAALYQDAYCPTGAEAACVSAFNIDLEPHIFAEWTTDQAQARQHYITAVGTISAALRNTTRLAGAVTNWYDGASYTVGTQNMLSALISAGMTRLYLMNYVDVASSIVSRAAGEVTLACSANAEVVSLSDAMLEGTTAADDALTFYEEGYAAMNSAWSVMNAAYVAQPCFTGNGAFDYDDVIALGP